LVSLQDQVQSDVWLDAEIRLTSVIKMCTSKALP
jgi:hypothetical protein